MAASNRADHSYAGKKNPAIGRIPSGSRSDHTYGTMCNIPNNTTPTRQPSGKKRTRSCFAPTGKAHLQISKWPRTLTHNKEFSVWKTSERQFLLEYVRSTPRSTQESVTEYWQTCADLMNKNLPGGHKNGIACKSLAQRMSIAPSSALPTSRSHTTDVGIKTEFPDISDGQRVDLMFMEPKKDLMTHKKEFSVWKTSERQFLLEYVRSSPRSTQESVTEYWQRCADLMNTELPGSNRNGNACKGLAQRLFINPSSASPTPKLHTTDVGIKTELPDTSCSQRADLMFIDPKKDMMTHKKEFSFWKTPEKEFLLEYARATPRSSDESITEYWHRCADIMNKELPGSHRNGNACKSLAQRLFIAPSSASSTPGLHSTDIGTQTEFPDMSDGQRAELMFMEPKKELMIVSQLIPEKLLWATSDIQAFSVILLGDCNEIQWIQ